MIKVKVPLINVCFMKWYFCVFSLMLEQFQATAPPNISNILTFSSFFSLFTEIHTGALIHACTLFGTNCIFSKSCEQYFHKFWGF